MELHEANRILRSVKAALAADGVKLPPSAETDGLMMLLGRVDGEKFLVPKIKHARAAAASSSTRKRAAAYLSFFRALMAYVNGIPDPATTVSFTMLNRALFGDLEDAAGRTRQAEYIENGSAHTDAKYITGSIKSIVAKMNDIQSSPDISKQDFAGYLTHYMRELIILHPFECGSPFTVRMFIMLFCKMKGFALCYYRSSPAAIKAAETAAFVADDVTELFRIFADCLSYEQTTEKKRTSPKTRREINRDNTPQVLPVENDEKTADEPERAEKPNKPEKYEKTEKTDKPDKPDKAVKAEKPEKTERPEKPEKPEKNDKQEKRERPEQKTERPRPDKKSEKRRPPRPQADKDNDRLKRAIKLQQKISRLNEQLTELMIGEKTDD